MKHQIHVVTLQDISCLGRCSLTVALPILSAAGIETSIIPSAILSTHTGGFTGYAFRDLNDDIMPIVDHWLTLDDVKFDAFYTGYLASAAQIALATAIKDKLAARGALYTMVDPAMADGGKMYPAFDDDFAKVMLTLCQKADLIVPNTTEATKMVGLPWHDGVWTTEEVAAVFKALHAAGVKTIVLTSVSYEDGKVGTVFENESGVLEAVMRDRVPGYFHGSGDVYSSALLAAILKGRNVREAVTIATDYTVSAIRRTKRDETPVRYGIDFEEEIPGFIVSLAK